LAKRYAALIDLFVELPQLLPFTTRNDVAGGPWGIVVSFPPGGCVSSSEYATM